MKKEKFSFLFVDVCKLSDQAFASFTKISKQKRILLHLHG